MPAQRPPVYFTGLLELTPPELVLVVEVSTDVLVLSVEVLP
jgi:hypothetical protein